jgi:hypothetical protein
MARSHASFDTLAACWTSPTIAFIALRRSLGCRRGLEENPSFISRATYRLGRLQRQTRRAFLAHPRRRFYTAELVRDWCFPRFVEPIERKHCWTVMRAARQVAVSCAAGLAGRRRLAGGKSDLGNARFD